MVTSATPISFNFERLHRMVNNAADDSFFRGLVSARLGSDKVVDDELIGLIVANSLLGEIFRDLCRTPGGQASINKAVSRLPTPVNSTKFHHDDITARRTIWKLAVDDPRFDLVLKQSLDEAKPSPAVSRTSGLSVFASIIDKIRDVITSGAARHTNGVLAASVVSAIVAGIAAGHYVLQPQPATQVSVVAKTDDIVNRLDKIANKLPQTSSNVSDIQGLSDRISKQEGALQQLREDVLKFGPDHSTITTFDNSVKQLTSNVTSINEALTLSNSSFKQLINSSDEHFTQLLRSSNNNFATLLSAQATEAGELKGELKNIALGIGVPDESKKLPPLRESAQQIATDLAPAPADNSKSSGNTSGTPLRPPPSPKSTPSAASALLATSGKSSTSAGTVTQTSSTSSAQPPTQTIAVSLKEMTENARALNALAAGSATLAKVFEKNQPVYFLGQGVVNDQSSTTAITRFDGSPCEMTWSLISTSSSGARLSLDSNTCGITLPNNTPMVLDHSQKRLKGTNLSVAFERPDQIRIWPFSPKGAILAFYQNPSPEKNSESQLESSSK